MISASRPIRENPFWSSNAYVTLKIDSEKPSRVNHVVRCLRTHARRLIAELPYLEAIKIAFRWRKTLKLLRTPSTCTNARIESCGNPISGSAVSYARPQKFTFGVHGRPRLERTAERMRSSAVACMLLEIWNRISSRFWTSYAVRCHFSINSTRIGFIFDYRYCRHPAALSFATICTGSFGFV